MILGIIAEYNPFHNGHLYHLLKTKEETKADYVVAVLGGNFTQRGEPSIVDKWTKAEMAIANGVDLVLELPVLYNTSSAENFADGAIKLLNSLKIVDTISFGAETPDLNKLNIVANTLHLEPKKYKSILSVELAKGLSFPKARENSIVQYLKDDSYKKIISSSNNILAIEYLKALKKYKSRMKPYLLERKDLGYLNLEYNGNIASGSAIRNLIKKNDFETVKTLLPPHSYTILTDEIKKGHFVLNLDCFEKIILYNLRNMSKEKIATLAEVSEGLENSIKKTAMSCNSINEFINIIRSKRYTETKLKRILLYSLLNITKKDMLISKRNIPYARVLGFNSNGQSLISKISKANPNLKIITSVKKFADQNTNKNLAIMLDKDIYATNVYTLGFSNDSWGNLDFTHKII